MKFAWATMFVAIVAGSMYRPTAARQESGSGPDVPGRAVYESTCSRCHGADGRGERAPWLIPFRWSYAEATDIIRHGSPCGMPAFSESELNDDAIHQLVDYLKLLTDQVEHQTRGTHDSTFEGGIGTRGGDRHRSLGAARSCS
jgi:mono/diheme cytochrome c family protein